MRVLATILADDGQTEAALAEARLAVERRPAFARNQEVLGWAHYRAGHWPEAADAYRRITELQPDNAWAFQMLGSMRHYAGDLDGAATAYREALRLAPDASAWANLGYVHFARGSLSEALEAYDEGVRLAPSDATIRRSRGDVRAKAGDVEGARDDWRTAADLSRKALETNPRGVDELGQPRDLPSEAGEPRRGARRGPRPPWRPDPRARMPTTWPPSPTLFSKTLLGPSSCSSGPWLSGRA